jgi:adenylate cyclase
MADIFISYSRKDTDQAVALAERLRGAGADVWMDTAVLTASETWSAEIVSGIKSCTTFIVLLSPDAVSSHNVTKEVSLASEKRKNIMPIVVRACELSDAMEYALAGLQHVDLWNEEALERAFAKLGIHAGGPLSISNPHTTDTLRLAVLPFEDQSPAHDNEWFSDGLTDELISTLGKLDQLFVVDSQSSRIYKHAKLTAKEIASQLHVGHIVRGAVRKAGENIRVHATLIDTKSGATIWDEKFSGTMEDIFAIQEKTAIDIALGLKLTLTKDQVVELEDRGTENAEAYELYLKAYANPGVAREDYLRKINWLKQATALDPTYARAFGFLAVSYANYYRSLGGSAEVLALEKEATERAIELAPESLNSYNALANLYTNLGEHDKAIETARKIVLAAPKLFFGYSVVAFMYMRAGKLSEAALWVERALAISPASLRDHMNLIACYEQAGNQEQRKKAIIRAIPHVAQYLALHPDDQTVRALLMIYYVQIEEHDRAGDERDYLLAMREISANSYYQIAALYARQGKAEQAVEFLYKAAEKGFVDFNELCEDKWWFGCVHSLPNFESIITELKAIIAKASA